MITISNFSYAGTQKYVSHAVMLSFTKAPKTLCGMDVYELLDRVGQEWEVQETNEPHSVGCVKCLRLLTRRSPDAGDSATSSDIPNASVKSKSRKVTKRTQRG